MSRRHRRAALLLLLIAGTTLPSRADAQLPAFGRLEVLVAPAWQSWTFGKAVPLDTLSVTGASQVSLPFSLRLPVNARWTISADGAVASSRIETNDSSSSATSKSFTGLSDIRVRATTRIFGDALQLTLGVNVPTGAVNLSPVENDVMRVTAAPALDAQMPIAGTGLGGTAGVILARMISNWAWAFGASLEQRGTYAPLDAQIVGLQSRTELDPGWAGHFSIGTDGLIGANRLSLGIATDVYGADQLNLSSGGAAPRSETYQLGPTTSLAMALQVRSARIRNLTLRLNDHYRSGFRDANDVDVAGSSGNYIELGASGLIGSAGRSSLLLGVQLRNHTGLTVDNGFVGAAMTSVGATVGASLLTSALEFTPSVRLSAGTLKTTLVTTSITGVTIGASINRR